MKQRINPYLVKAHKLIEDAKLEFKTIIQEVLVNGLNEEEVKKRVEAVIKRTMNEYMPLKRYLKNNSFLTKNVLKANFDAMYKTTLYDFKTNYKDTDVMSTFNSLKQANKTIKEDDNYSYVIRDEQGAVLEEAPSLRYLRTSGEYGYDQVIIDNYVEKVEKEMQRLSAMTFVTVNKEGKAISLRNKAEMSVRYQETLDELKGLDGEKYVIVSQHKDSSLRCACWQGLIYLKDTDGSDVNLKSWREWNSDNNVIVPQPIGTLPDGQYYYSLKDAMEHGLFSYNCRHRFIKYNVGDVVPKQYKYDSQAAQEKREVDVKMRQMESKIRMLKEREKLALTPRERKKWIKKSKEAQAQYKTFANKHHRVREDWRTTIGSIENSTNKSNKPTINPVVSEIENKKVLDEIQLEDYQAFQTYIQNTPSANNLSVRFDIHVMGTKRRADELQNEYNRCVNKGKQFMGKSPLIKDSKYFEQRVFNPKPEEVKIKYNSNGDKIFRLHLEYNETIGYTIDDNILPATEYLNDKLDNYPVACKKVTIHIGKKGWHAVPESEW